jgi:hypothetical protein
MYIKIINYYSFFVLFYHKFCIFAVKLVIMDKNSQTIFDKNAIEFVTVAAEFCGFMERAGQTPKGQFVSTALKILPLLYLKASMIPPCERIGMFDPETFVTEADYELLRQRIAQLLGADDDYLEVFLPDMAYSDTPIKKCISEDLADIYQDLKDFICVFQLGLNETMNDSLVICREHFEEFWGQRLVNTMRALHSVKYNTPTDEEDDYRTDEEDTSHFGMSATDDDELI